ncbi:MAG: GtrA family protein [Sphingobium sp.]
MISLWEGLPQARRHLLTQLIRYAVVGLGVTSAQAAVYWMLATWANIHVQIANFAGYVTAVILGYFFHGCYTFADPQRQGGTGAHAARGSRFVIASLVSYGLNAMWVWLFVTRLGAPSWAPIPAMLFVTPALVFVLNKKWVFR